MNQAGRSHDIRYAPLSRSDLGAIVTTHLAATAAVGRNDLVKPESPEFFERILAGGGEVTGVWRDGSFVGYGILQTDLPPSEDARPHFGLAAADRLAKLAGACVLPQAWGVGIHDELIRIRIEQARRAGFPHLYATAAPLNARSWENLLSAGFAVRALVAKYGGHVRYLLYRREGGEAASSAPGDDVWCAVADTQGQQALLAEGRFGWAWRRRDEGGRDMSYRRPT